jgi:hypothetical protein
VLEGILHAFPDADLSVLVVWIAMMESDTPEAAFEASGKFSDARVEQFFDPGCKAGKIFARSLGHDSETAWDFYLFYPAGAEWRELPPEPHIYMHQLPDGWANPKRRFEKKKLKKKLAGTMKSLFP